MKTIEITWDAEADTARAGWNVYLSEIPNAKGKLIAKLDPDEKKHVYRGVLERTYYVRVLAFNKAGMEEGWEKSGGSAKHVVTASVTPSKPSNGGVQVTSSATTVRAVTSAQTKSDPKQKVEVIRGADPYTGQKIGEAEQLRDDTEGEAGSRNATFSFPVSPGRGNGTTAIYNLRGVTVEGAVPGASYTALTLPQVSLPNFTTTTLASISGLSVTNFPTPTETMGWELNATDGFRMRELPAISASTTAWGTMSAGVLARQPMGAFYVTSATVTSATIDLGSVKNILLECYDEMQRKDAAGAFSTIRLRDANFPMNPLQDGWPMTGSAGLSRLARMDGKPVHPIPRTRWEYRFGNTSAMTAGTWQESLPMQFVRTRYLQARFHVKEPTGFWQQNSERVYVVAHHPWSEVEVPTANLPISYAGLLVVEATYTQTATTTFALIDGWTNLSVSLNATGSTTTNLITVPDAGTYEIKASISFEGATGRTYEVCLWENGAKQNECFHRKLGSTDVGDAGLIAHKVATAGSTFGLRVQVDLGSQDFTMVDGQFLVNRIA